MKVGEEEYADFSTVSYKSYKNDVKTPIKRYATVLAIVFCIIGLFLLSTSFIVMYQAPSFMLQFADKIIFAMLPFVSFNKEVIGIVPTSVLFLLLSFIMFFLKDEKGFTLIQGFIAIVCIVSFLYFILSI